MPAVKLPRGSLLLVVQHPDPFDSLFIISTVTPFGELNFNRREQQLLEVIQLPGGDRKFEWRGKSFFQGVAETLPARIRTDI